MVVNVITDAGSVSVDRVLHRSVAVIDVFRATSVMVEALANGAEAVIPVVTIEDATALCERYGRQRVLLGGERDAVIIDGFDLGNSPLSYTSHVVKGKTIIMTTTNGTRTVHNSRGAAGIYIASFLNMTAVCRRLVSAGRDIVLVCSGRNDEYTAEDGLCAGAMVQLLKTSYGCDLTDMADLVMRDYMASSDNLLKRLENTTHYKYISAKGYNDDIDFCLSRDVYDIVPTYNERGEIKLAKHE